MNAKIILGLGAVVMGLALAACGPIVVTNEAGQAVELPAACYFDADYECTYGGRAVTCGGEAGIPGTLCQPYGAADGTDYWCCD